MNIGEKIRNAREDMDLSQRDMANLIPMNQSNYSKIERGKRYYTFEQCRKLAIALDTSMDYLAGLTDEKRPYPRTKEE